MDAETVYLFKHALMRDAAYQLQLPGQRARLHALVLEIVESLAGGAPPWPPLQDHVHVAEHPLDSLASELAQHAALAQRRDRKSPAMAARERLYLARAARYAARHFRNAEAIALWRRLAERDFGERKTRALVYAGQIAGQVGRVHEAEELLEQARAAAKKCRDENALASAHGSLAHLYTVTGRYAEAEQCFLSALTLFRKTGNRGGEGHTLTNQGNFFRERSRFEESARAHESALAIQRSLGDAEGVSTALGSLGILFWTHGELQRAESAFIEALDVHRGVGSRRLEGVLRGNMASVYKEMGRFSDAWALYEQALAIHREVGNRRQEGSLLGSIGVALNMEARRFEAAEACLLQSLAINREVANRQGESQAMSNLASIYNDMGRIEEAAAAFERALELRRSVGDRMGEGITLGSQAVFTNRHGDAQKARTMFEAALMVHREVKNGPWLAEHLCDYALCLLKLSDTTAAIRAWNEAMELMAQPDQQANLQRKLAEMKTFCAQRALAAL